MLRLLALDIDHTLTGNGESITKANAEAVAWAVDRGVKVTLITGRRYTGSASIQAEVLGLTGPIACHYGRRIVDHPSGQILENHPMPPGSASALVKAAREQPETIVWAFIGDHLVFDRFPAGWPRAAFAQMSEGNLEERIAREAGEVMSIGVGSTDAADLAHASEAVARIGERLYPGQLSFYFIPMGEAPRRLVTAMSSAADKGTALVELARLVGVDPAETLAMGDSEADVPMLRAAGVGVAMPWSVEEVRRQADLVAEGEPEDAVGRTIRKLIGAR